MTEGPRTRPSLRHQWLVVVVLAAALSGCARYYWAKPAGTAEQFDRDSRECAAEAAPKSAPGEYTVFRTELYRTCLSSRGWLREKQWDPPAAGWFRGYE
jgi:hypothetical protein